MVSEIPSAERVPSRRLIALVYSGLVHALLLLALANGLPVVRSVPEAIPTPVPEDRALRLTFVTPEPEPEPTLEQPRLPPGQVPIPVPAARAPAEPSAFLDEPPPAASAQGAPPGAALAERAASEAQDLGPEDRAGGPERASKADATGAPRSFERASSGSRVDLDRALENFGRALEKARADGAARPGTSRSPSHVFVPDAGDFPTTGYGMGNLVFETRDFDWSGYARQIYVAIWRAWHDRLYRTVDDFEKWAHANGWYLEHQARIGFVIERSGEVTGIEVEWPSGCQPLDDSAAGALDEVILPPLPADFPKAREVVHARFIADGEIRYMRPVLTRGKQLGFF